MDYPNVPKMIGLALMTGKASFRDLDEYMGVEDVYDLIEVEIVNARNMRAERKRQERKARNR
jgi:hypothetical protein